MEWVVLGLMVVVFFLLWRIGRANLRERRDATSAAVRSRSSHRSRQKTKRKTSSRKRAQGKRSGSSRVPSKSRSRGDSAAGRVQEGMVSCRVCGKKRHPAEVDRCIDCLKTRRGELGVAPLWAHDDREDESEWRRVCQREYGCKGFEDCRWQSLNKAYGGEWESCDRFFGPRCSVCEQQLCECVGSLHESETECTICEEVFLDECRCG